MSLRDSRFFGKQFSTSPTKKGVTNDTTFSPFTSNAVVRHIPCIYIHYQLYTFPLLAFRGNHINRAAHHRKKVQQNRFLQSHSDLVILVQRCFFFSLMFLFLNLNLPRSGSGDTYGLFQTFEYSLNDKKPEDPVAKRRALSPDGRSLPNFYTSPGAPGGASYPHGAIGGTKVCLLHPSLLAVPLFLPLAGLHARTIRR